MIISVVAALSYQHLSELALKLFGQLGTGEYAHLGSHIRKAEGTRALTDVRGKSRYGLTRTVKIATFNINNINKRLDNLLDWLARSQPDVVCLQELKTEKRAFPYQGLRAVDYHAVWEGERSWNGVAILARGREPVLTRSKLPGDHEDDQARYIEAAVHGVLIASLYLPNGNPYPGPKFNYKLRWFERLIAHGADLIEARVPVVLAGDYNVVPTEHDVYPTRSLDKNALIQLESRQAFARLLAQGWTDALREMHPEGQLWTFWDYKRERWPADKGMRLDHLLLSPSLSPQLIDAGVDRWVRGEPNASDHAPAWILLDPGSPKTRTKSNEHTLRDETPRLNQLWHSAVHDRSAD